MRSLCSLAVMALFQGPVAAQAEMFGLANVPRPDLPSARDMAETFGLVAARTAGRITLVLQPKSGDTVTFTLQKRSKFALSLARALRVDQWRV